jgi:hypothetical protein
MKNTVESQNIVVLKADKTKASPEIEAMLAELGNTAGGIPYYAVFRPGEDVVHFDGNFISTRGFLAEAGIDPNAKVSEEKKTTTVSGESKTTSAEENSLDSIEFDPVIDLSTSPAK